MPKVNFLDLSAQNQSVRAEIDIAIKRVIDSNQFVLGPEVEAFESAFAAKLGVAHAIAVNSGSSALHLAMLAAGIGFGDEVITVPMTFVASAATIGYTGARTTLVDIHPESYTLDPTKLEAAITRKTKAIIPVHLYGQPADMDPILEISKQHNLIIIEDCAQAHLAQYHGKPVGSIGDLGCFSFYPGKNLGACGEGGMVVTNNEEYAREVRIYRDWGQDGKYNHIRKGFNYRMDAIHGAVLAVKLNHLEHWTELRRIWAARYDENLRGSKVVTPTTMDYSDHAYHLYATRVCNRDMVRQKLAELGIETNIHYPTPVHLLPAYRDFGYELGDFPVAEQLAQEELSLPLYAEMTPDDIDLVSESIINVLS
jgi:dTDP-4-amino-4,6-dideoxygalactose transaminase